MAATNPATQYKDFADLYFGLMEAVHVSSGVTATDNQAKRYINIGLQDMHIGWGEKFPWAEQKDHIRGRVKYTTGTVTATKGSTTITGASTAWNTNDDFSVANMRAGGKIHFGGNEVYEISSVASDTSATLTQAFISTTISGGSYTYLKTSTL